MMGICFTSFAFVGAALIVALSLPRRERKLDFLVAYLLIAGTLACAAIVGVAASSQNPTLDGIFFSADRAIGLGTLPLARDCFSIPLLWIIIAVSYDALPLMIAIAWVTERSKTYLTATLIAALVSPVCYVLFPAVGPRAAFADFPFSSPHPGYRFLTEPAGLPRNAFPSLHFAWALLIYVYARGRAMKAIAFVFALLTAIATMGSGEHYAVDLLGSVPFVLAVSWAAESIPALALARKRRTEGPAMKHPA